MDKDNGYNWSNCRCGSAKLCRCGCLGDIDDFDLVLKESLYGKKGFNLKKPEF